MQNQEIIQKFLKNRLMEIADNDETKAKDLWQRSQGTTLDDIAIRSKVFKGFKWCFKCGAELDFIVAKNFIPHCLLPCEIN